MIRPFPSNRLERVKELLEKALELDAGDRDAFLASSCGTDNDLRLEVESLLSHEDVDGAWPEAPLLPKAAPPPLLKPDQRVGPYRILEVLGQGGMGTVALAVREDQFEKKVALKVIRPEQLAPDLRRRFRNEQQILAQLEHPSIARILDAGTLGGEQQAAGHRFGFPYFVMELVEGDPIDRHCDERSLPLEQRIELFLEVCSAVSYAHRNLVVHRDLKPSNILVTHRGQPKLLDFGIAKKLEPGAEQTRAGERPMTVRYASPEQLEGRAITTATDVYSLGLLLFRLLTGGYPYAAEGDSDVQLAFAIGREQPLSPSEVAPAGRSGALRGDLDSIILKALAKEPDQRYSSVDQMAEDLRRHLGGRPVSTRAGSWVYRTTRLLRRHWLALGSATILVALSLTFALVSTSLRKEAEQAEQIAESARIASDVNEARARNIIDFIRGLFRAAPNLSGDDLDNRNRVILALLQEGEQELEKLPGDDRLIRPELLLTFGEIYRKLGQFDLARGSFERAEDLLRDLGPEGLPLLAKVINNLAAVDYDAGDHVTAEGLYREALAIKQRFPRDTKGIDLSKSFSNLASSLMGQGKYAEASPFLHQALELRLAEHGRNHTTVATSLRSLGVLHFTLDQLDLAEPLLREALEIRQRLLDANDTRLASAWSSLGRLLLAQGRLGEAEAVFGLALESRQSGLGEDHLYTANSHLDLARLYLELGDIERAEPHLDQAWSLFVSKRSEDSIEIADAKGVKGVYLTHFGRFEEAKKLLLESQEGFLRIYGADTLYARQAEERLAELARARKAKE